MRTSVKILISFILLVSISCQSSRTALHSGYYDVAINKAVNKLRKNSRKEKQVLVLEEAFKKAQQADLDRINFLKKEGTPDIWDEVFNHYLRIKSRQERVKALPALRVESENRTVNFQFINCDEEVIQAKQKAAEYFYAHGLELLTKGDRENARKAYVELQRVKNFYQNYKDTDAKIREAIALGTSYVIFKMKNQTGIPLPPRFEEDLTKISLAELNRQWLQYHTQEIKGVQYDYSILVNMKIIDVSPEGLKEVRFTESKEVEDGWQYVLDAKGNVKKDSLGNDIKVKKFKTITCNVIETQQRKTARIAGTIDYLNTKNGQLIKSDPITADALFEHSAVAAIGDLNALKQETKKRVGTTPVPFPSSFDMLLQAGEIIKKMTKDIIWANKEILY